MSEGGVIVPGTAKSRRCAVDLRADDGAGPGRVARRIDGLTVRILRDQEHLDVLPSLTTFSGSWQAGSEVSALLGPHAFRGGYQPNLNTKSVSCKRRITSTEERFDYVGAGDLCACGRLHGPRSGREVTHLDATTNLSRQIVERGIYPAVDPGPVIRAFWIRALSARALCRGSAA